MGFLSKHLNKSYKKKIIVLAASFVGSTTTDDTLARREPPLRSNRQRRYDSSAGVGVRRVECVVPRPCTTTVMVAGWNIPQWHSENSAVLCDVWTRGLAQCPSQYWSHPFPTGTALGLSLSLKLRPLALDNRLYFISLANFRRKIELFRWPSYPDPGPWDEHRSWSPEQFWVFFLDRLSMIWYKHNFAQYLRQVRLYSTVAF